MTERWRKMVEKAIRSSSLPDRLWLNDKEVVTLLASQHRAFVRMVKEQIPPACMRIGYKHGYQDAQRDILAALAKQGGRKK